MSNQSCPIGSGDAGDADATILRMLSARRIAVVGLSDDPSRPSYEIARYLLSAGREVIPVNPNVPSVLGRKAYARLEDVPGPIDLVNVFRRPEHCAQVAESAVAVGAKGLWLQSGITSAEAQEIAARAGMSYVENRCIMVEHMRRSSEIE